MEHLYNGIFSKNGPVLCLSSEVKYIREQQGQDAHDGATSSSCHFWA